MGLVVLDWVSVYTPRPASRIYVLTYKDIDHPVGGGWTVRLKLDGPVFRLSSYLLPFDLVFAIPAFISLSLTLSDRIHCLARLPTRPNPMSTHCFVLVHGNIDCSRCSPTACPGYLSTSLLSLHQTGCRASSGQQTLPPNMPTQREMITSRIPNIDKTIKRATIVSCCTAVVQVVAALKITVATYKCVVFVNILPMLELSVVGRLSSECRSHFQLQAVSGF